MFGEWSQHQEKAKRISACVQVTSGNVKGEEFKFHDAFKPTNIIEGVAMQSKRLPEAINKSPFDESLKSSAPAFLKLATVRGETAVQRVIVET